MMAEENILAPEPTRRDEPILHCSEWLQIRKGNLLLDLQKLQKNPIFRISVDIRQNTNFVRAFTTSANVPSIYIQLFWNTLTHDAKTRVYSFQVDEHWLTLSVDLLRKALDVTPADSAHPFESPPAGKTASQDETTGPSVYPEDATSTKIDEYQVGSNSEQSHVALAGPNPEHMHDNPPSSSRTLSSMKNLEDNFTFGDQVINDKSQEDELGKTTVESEVESMVIVPIQQASSFARPLNTHVIDLSSPKLKDYEILLQQVFNEYFNPPPRAVSLDPVSIVASRAIDPVGSPSSTTIDQDEHLLVLHQQIKKFNLKSLIKSNFDKKSTTKHAIWCYFDANDNPNPFDGKRSGWDLLSQRKMSSEQLGSGLRLHQMTSEQLNGIEKVTVKLQPRHNSKRTFESGQRGSTINSLGTFPFILSFPHCGNRLSSRDLCIILVILPEHPSDTQENLKDGDGDYVLQQIKVIPPASFSTDSFRIYHESQVLLLIASTTVNIKFQGKKSVDIIPNDSHVQRWAKDHMI
ncbi:hypothetical protein Tco_1482099 [Tanacetum coccineum]